MFVCVQEDPDGMEHEGEFNETPFSLAKTSLAAVVLWPPVAAVWHWNGRAALQTAIQKLSCNVYATFPQCCCRSSRWSVPNMCWKRFAVAVECLWCHAVSHRHFYESSGSVLKSTPPSFTYQVQKYLWSTFMPKVLWRIFYAVLCSLCTFLHLFFYMKCYLVPLK